MSKVWSERKAYINMKKNIDCRKEREEEVCEARRR